MRLLTIHNSLIFKNSQKKIHRTSWLTGLFIGTLLVCPQVMATTYYESSPGQQSQMSNQPGDGYPGRLYVAEQVNPWSLPRKVTGQTNPESEKELSGTSSGWSSDRYFNDPGASSCAVPMKAYRDGQSMKGRFVTPDILGKLKSQQMQYQVMPENRWQNSRSNLGHSNNMGRINPNYRSGYGYGPGGPGNYYPVPGSDPLYDSPMVSPWSSSPDVLYRGEQFPMVPSEALGGFPPVHVSPFSMNLDDSRDVGEPPTEGADKVFNPFTFLPNYGSH